jgi:hypothetical protein
MSNRTASEIKAINALIDATDGKWFTVTFIKRTDGTLRTMTCRTGVKKYVNGVGLAYDPKSLNLRSVWVANEGKEGADAYRSINLETVTEIKANGKELLYA